MQVEITTIANQMAACFNAFYGSNKLLIEINDLFELWKLNAVLDLLKSISRIDYNPLKTVDQNNHHLPDITTLIHGYNANDIVIDSDCFVPLQEIRNVAYKKTEKL